MTRNQFDRLYQLFFDRLCPICHSKYIYFSMDSTESTIFNKNTHELQHFSQIEIPSGDNIEIECPRCGFIMKFNRKILLK